MAALTESDWLAQLMAMQDAVAALNITSDTPEYGCDLDLTDDNSSDDYDDLFETADQEDSNTSGDDYEDDGLFNVQWLERQCDGYSRRNPAGLGSGDLTEKLLSLLQGKEDDHSLQSILVDILGYEDLDFVGDLVSHRDEIVTSAATHQTYAPIAPGGGEDALIRLMTREQRMEALQQADFEHKSKPLAAASDPAADYPHIYRAYDAGNTLSAFGKKYSLPMGSTDVDEPFYKEITIPATKVGTVKKGEKQVFIKDMDMLCQRTFPGYTKLNRMQSLVYPVAYKTNENMLICAPTGAVSSILPLFVRDDMI